MLGADIIDPYSSGSRPSGKVNDKAVTSMKEIGYDLTGHRSKGLDEIPDIEYDWVVTMGCADACPIIRAKQREDWAIPDPKTMPMDQFVKVRDLIRQKIEALIESLKSK